MDLTSKEKGAFLAFLARQLFSGECLHRQKLPFIAMHMRMRMQFSAGVTMAVLVNQVGAA
jgi:hypothetical protein